MKRIGMILTAAFIVALGMSSCEESREKKDQAISYKIEANDTLSAEDYSRIIDYVGEYAEKAQKYLDLQINNTDTQEATEGMNKLAEEYPYLDQFRNCLRHTPLSKFTPENIEKMQRYAGLLEFSVPAGFTLTTDTEEAAGMLVSTPDSTVENGVIAGAVDSVTVDENRGF